MLLSVTFSFTKRYNLARKAKEEAVRKIHKESLRKNSNCSSFDYDSDHSSQKKSKVNPAHIILYRIKRVVAK